jgi:mRNA-degrading endonuclease toxin of MazEF toxin-antitoxin module
VYPTEVLLDPGDAGQPEESIAMAHQLRTLSTRRLGVRLGTLVDAGLRHQLRTAIRVYLDLET